MLKHRWSHSVYAVNCNEKNTGLYDGEMSQFMSRKKNNFEDKNAHISYREIVQGQSEQDLEEVLCVKTVSRGRTNTFRRDLPFDPFYTILDDR